MRAENPELKGVRTAELKAAIIRNQTGCNVSPATIKRQEQTARRVEQGLTEEEARQEASRCLRCDHFGFGAFRGGGNLEW